MDAEECLDCRLESGSHRKKFKVQLGVRDFDRAETTTLGKSEIAG